MEIFRCPWCLGDQDYIGYHDEEWGVPIHDDHKLFSLLILEGAQAGLSWLTILKRRPGYLAAMDSLDPEKLARYSDDDLRRLATDSRIIRNRRKIHSAKENAQAFLELRDQGTGLGAWLWDRLDGKPLVNQWKTMAQIPTTTPLAESISRDLKKLGFSFVGPTIIYSYLQSAGFINDHLVDCFRYRELTSGALAY